MYSFVHIVISSSRQIVSLKCEGMSLRRVSCFWKKNCMLEMCVNVFDVRRVGFD